MSAAFGPEAASLRDRLLGPWAPLFLWRTLPLAAFAGLRVARLDEQACSVRLPGGWRTTNPFRSTYFAAQAMAAEMSTGAPALVAVRDSTASVASLVVGLRASYTRKLVGPGQFTFEDVAGLRAAVEAASSDDTPRPFTARTTGRDRDDAVVAAFEIDWSFRRRPRP